MIVQDDELERLLGDIESDRVERKESLKGDVADTARQAICAFANDLPDHRRPGVLFLGVKDDGTPTGMTVTDAMLQQLADMRSDGNILPLPMISVEKRRMKCHEVAVVLVQPSDAPPVRYKGRIYIRVGPRRAIASAQEERVLNEKRRRSDLPYDLRPVSHATLHDISKALFEEYLQAAIAPDILEANNRTYEERLAAVRMIDSVERRTPTVLGCLVLCPHARERIPGNYIQFLRIDGTSLSDPIIDTGTIDGPLANMLNRLDDKLAAHVRTAVDITQAKERRSADYPLIALQQLTRNAIMHRTYESTNAPVRVTWFNDRIEITNPGGPYGIVTKQNFGKAGYTDYRNPHLAEAMKVLGFVQRYGVGIQTAQNALKMGGNPPALFDPEESLVRVTVYARSHKDRATSC